MKAQRSRALTKSEVTVTSKETNAVTHHEARTKMGDHAEVKPGQQVAMIKVSNGITLSMGYQSVRMDVGVEMPWATNPNDIANLKSGFDAAYQFLDDELAARARDLDGLLRELVKKYR